MSRRQRELARERRRRRTLLAYASVASVLLVVVVMVLVRVVQPERQSASPTPASAVFGGSLVVAPAALDAVGRGTATSVPVRLTGQPPLVADAKPLVLYIGAEYCPFCAAQRWALTVAMTRFGTFSGLRLAWSGAEDVFPSTATLSFHGMTYRSEYLSFQGVELATSERQGGRYAPLDTLSPEQEKVMQTYNAPPYVAPELTGSVPFVDFGNGFIHSGSAFSPAVLKGLTQEQIATALKDPASPVGQAVLGSANAMTAVLCGLTGGRPAAVCASPAVRAFGELGVQA